MTSLARRIAVVCIVLLVILAVGLSLTRITQRTTTDTKTPVVLEELPVTPPPPITESMRAVLEKSKGFVVLVSYTNAGFEPADVSIAQGQTVRFTNNSSRTMWIMSKGGSGGVYPATSESCGQSEFDTCKALAPHEIWEFTFSVPGTWAYQNNARTKDTGTIRVK